MADNLQLYIESCAAKSFTQKNSKNIQINANELNYCLFVQLKTNYSIWT